MSEKLWSWYPTGKYEQCCCYCGRPVPVTRPRKVLNRKFSPVPTKAVLKHPACKGTILYNRVGVRIKELAIKKEVTE